MSDTADFFRSRLDQMIDLRHPLAVLSSRLLTRVTRARAQNITRSLATSFVTPTSVQIAIEVAGPEPSGS